MQDGQSDMDAAARLVEEVERVARRSGDAAAVRDDLVQETLLRVWCRMRERGETGIPGGLLATVLRRVRVDRWRRRQTRDRATAEASPGTTGGIGPLEQAGWRELAAVVTRLVGDLPEPQREVLRLRIHEGLKFKEIARVQNVPLNTVLGRMHRALTALRARLGEVDDPDR